MCFVPINSVLFNLLCVWILFWNASSHSCFRFVSVIRHAGCAKKRITTVQLFNHRVYPLTTQKWKQDTQTHTYREIHCTTALQKVHCLSQTTRQQLLFAMLKMVPRYVTMVAMYYHNNIRCRTLQNSFNHECVVTTQNPQLNPAALLYAVPCTSTGRLTHKRHNQNNLYSKTKQTYSVVRISKLNNARHIKTDTTTVWQRGKGILEKGKGKKGK